MKNFNLRKSKKVYSQITGEWWIIDGSANYADGDIGDMNHEMYVIDHVRRKYVYGEFDSDIVDWDGFKKFLAKEKYEEDGKNIKEFENLSDEMIEELYLFKLKEMEMSNEEYMIAEGMGDARKYGIEKLGWKRVAGKNIQTNTLTVDDLREISNGLWDAYQDNAEVSEFNIEVSSTGAFYTDVPYSVICDNSTSSLRLYAKNWYNKYIMSKVKKTIPKDDYKKIVDIVNRIVKGNHEWELEDLALQQEYPDVIEKLLMQKYEKKYRNLA
jgi:hypothetical protein